MNIRHVDSTTSEPYKQSQVHSQWAVQQWLYAVTITITATTFKDGHSAVDCLKECYKQRDNRTGYRIRALALSWVWGAAARLGKGIEGNGKAKEGNGRKRREKASPK